MSKEALINISNLSKTYSNETSVLRNINLEIYSGQWTNIMGPSGSGKTTLLNILGCLDKPTHGSIAIGGTELSGMSQNELAKFRRENIGLVFQQYHLVPYLSALENVMLAQYFHSTTDEDDAKQALEKVGLGHRINHIPGHMSGGEQQRVAIARALINQPKIILADEPTGNLDLNNSQIILELFNTLHTEGHTIVMVTHDPTIGERGDRLVMIRDGRIDNEENKIAS